MRFPSKVTSYKDSIISKFPIILKELTSSDLSPKELYSLVKKKVSDIAEFLDILSCLFALNEIEMIRQEVLHYVKKD